ncbi:MAG: allantoinase PuuE [Alphaproteobacteria bacterium]|nr:allantoinase PuuE [Alphaproteobacteria bacterium]
MLAKDGERDLIGYGPNPPDPEWPDGARVALNFVLNIEEGSEYSIGNGDGFSEATLTEMSESWVPRGDRDLAAEAMFEYGSRVGVWRVLRLFQERGIPLTIFGCAMALELNPALAQAIRDNGYDVCCHGWRWVEHFRLPEAEEREHIRRAVASLQKTVGERPLGWYCRYGPGVNTRRLLVEEGGFLYDSDMYNDELPYYMDVGGKAHLIVPYSLANNDVKFARGGFATAADYAAFHIDAFDFMRDEGKKAPKMMSVGLHARLIGHPARAAGLARFLDHVARHRHAWTCRRIDIARHWLARHPAQGARHA